MVQIKKPFAIFAAEALLVDIAFDDHRRDEKLEALFALERLPENLAFMAESVFHKWDILPDIYDSVGKHLGENVQILYGIALYEIDQSRKQRGAKPLPLEFVDEQGCPNNVVYMEDYLHLRRAAA